MKTFIKIISAVLLTANASAQVVWHQIQTPTQQKLNTIQFISNEVGFVGGDSIILKTMDGGLSWTELQIDSIPISVWQGLDIYDMHWFNENHAMIMSGVWGGAYETFDGGANWDHISLVNGGFCQTTSLFFFDEDLGFAGGAGCFEGHIIERFSDGSWSTTNDPENWDSQGWISSIEFSDADNGLAGTVDGRILRTTDGGLNWDTVTNVAGDSAITDFIFHGAGVVRATHRNNSGFGVMISNDAGLTWEVDMETATFFYPRMNAAHIDVNGTSYLGGVESNSNVNGVIFDNSAGFWNWGSVSQPVNDITSHSDSITFLVGDSGTIFVSVNPITLSVKDVPKIDFAIAPNPSIDHIQINGLSDKLLSYSILDMTGRIVERFRGTISNGESLNISELRPGSYFITIETVAGIGTQRFIKH